MFQGTEELLKNQVLVPKGKNAWDYLQSGPEATGFINYFSLETNKYA